MVFKRVILIFVEKFSVMCRLLLFVLINYIKKFEAIYMDCNQ